MSSLNEDPSSDVVDFIGRFLEDSQNDQAEALETYLRRYPGHESEIRIAHANLIAERSAVVPEPKGLGATPKNIGDYRVIKRLGAGGQGIVYLAEDTQLGRRVALKVLHPAAVGSRSARERFRREAEVISRLDDPGFCSVFEANLDDEVQYIAMRFLDGETLSHAIARAREQGDCASSSTSSTGASSIDSTLRKFESVARSLHVAHEAGVIHRDIKPGNVIATNSGEYVVLDFGLARSASSDGPTLTMTGDVFGTPAYMSPELLTADANVDRRTDVYSLGLTLYECLTLERPFKGTGLEGQRRAVLYDRLPDPIRFNSEIPRELATVLETALEKDIDRRYATALEFADELRRIRQREPIHARRPTLAYHFSKFVERNRRATAVLVTLIVLLFAAAYGFLVASTAKNNLARTSAAQNRVLAVDYAIAGDAFEATRKLDASSWLGDSWESRFVRHLLNQAVRTYPNGPRNTRELQVADNGRMAVAANQDELHILDLEAGTWRLLTEIEQSGKRPTWDLCSTGDRLVMTFNEGPVRVLDTTSGATLWARDFESAPLSSVLNSDGSRLASSARFTPAVKIFDVAKDEVLHAFDAAGSGSRLRFVDNDQALVGLSMAALWRWNDGRVTTVASPSRSAGINMLARDGSATVAAGSSYKFFGSDGTARSTGHLERQPRTLLSSEQVLISRIGRGMQVFDPWTGSTLGFLAGHETFVSAYGLNREGLLLASDRNGNSKLWDLTQGISVPRALLPKIGTAAISERRIVTVTDSRYIVWDAASMSESFGRLCPPSHGEHSVSIAPSGDFIALAGRHARSTVIDKTDDYRTSLIDAKTGNVLWTKQSAERPTAIAINPVSNEVAIGFATGFVEIINDEGKSKRLVTKSGNEVRSLAWNPNGEQLTAVLFGKAGGASLVCWPGSDDRPLWSVHAHDGPSGALAYSPDGTQLATGGGDETIRVWDISNGEQLKSIEGLGARVACLAFHPTEPRLAAMVGSQLWMWDIRDRNASPLEVVSTELNIGSGITLRFRDEGGTLSVVGTRGIATLETQRPDKSIARIRESTRRRRASMFGVSADSRALYEIRSKLDAPTRELALIHENVDQLNRKAWSVLTRPDFSRERYEQALDWLKRAVAIAPERGRYQNTLALAHIRLEQYREAIGCLLKAERLNAETVPAPVGSIEGSSLSNLYLLAYSYAQVGEQEHAKPFFDKAERIRHRFFSKTETDQLRNQAIEAGCQPLGIKGQQPERDRD